MDRYALFTHKLLSLTHMKYSEHALYISPLHTVGLPPMKPENKLTDFSHPNPSGATVRERETKHDAISPASNITLGKPALRYHKLNHEECHFATYLLSEPIYC